MERSMVISFVMGVNHSESVTSPLLSLFLLVDE